MYLTTFLLTFLSSAAISAQTIKLDDPIPVDPDIRIGKLDNGLTYYLKYNARPENRLEMRLGVNAGAVLEDDDQNGLAHFVEHMAFNGSEHFEKNELVSFLESLGIKFGPELNAYTSFDETVYMLTIPSDSARLIDQGMLVMADWAQGLSFDHEEIDKERGVVTEEWRLHRGPDARMQDQYFPILLKGSKYAKRNVIGDMDIIANADYETVKRFYRDWYRPDLMAFVAVGDYDMDVMEQKVREYLGELENPENPRERVNYPVPDHEETLVALVSDPETPYTQVTIFNKTDVEKETHWRDYRQHLINGLFTDMLNQRLNDLREQADPPFIFAQSLYGNLIRTKGFYIAAAVVDEKGLERGMRTLLKENERVRQHGFTEAELERAKRNTLRQYETYYNERDKSESSQFADEYLRNFLEDEPIPGIEREYRFVKEHLDGIGLEEVNQLINDWLREENQVILVQSPEKEEIEIPSEDEILAMVSDVKDSTLEPYTEEAVAASLMEAPPAAGTIINEVVNDTYGFTELTLSNGVKVVLKSTDFKNDEIQMTAFSWGGHSVYPVQDNMSARYASAIVASSGVAEFSPADLRKILTGKIARVSPTISSTWQGFGGNCAPQDLETMLQLAYLYYTQPRKDAEAFQSFLTKQISLSQNQLSDPMNYFFDQYRRIRASHHPRAGYMPTPEELRKIDHDRAHEIYADRFSDASDLTVVMVGAFETAKVKPLLATYLGSLPSTGREESYRDLGIRPPEGHVEERVFKGLEPQSYVMMYFEQEAKYNKKDAYLLRTFGGILDRRYVEVLREEMSGTYGAGVGASLGDIPYERASMQINFGCSPEMTDSLSMAALGEVKDIIKNGITGEELQNTREIQRRSLERNLKENRWWLNSLRTAYERDDLSYINTDDKRIRELTSKDIQKVARKYIDPDKYLRVVLYPENMRDEFDTDSTTARQDAGQP